MTNNSARPQRYAWKAMRCPSGDQTGRASSLLLNVNWRKPLPSAFMTKMSRSGPSRSEAKAIFCPPRARFGSMSAAGWLVRRTGALPSSLLMTMSQLSLYCADW